MGVTIEKNCKQRDEIELIAYCCETCRNRCELGSLLMRARAEREKNFYHEKLARE